MATSVVSCISGEWMSLKTPGRTELLIWAREVGVALAIQVSRVMET